MVISLLITQLNGHHTATQNQLTSRKSAESTSDVKEVTIRSTGAISDFFLSISPARSFMILEIALEFP